MTDEFDHIIQEVVERHAPWLDWRLIMAQIEVESGGDPTAVSPCGAIGLMQIMPATAGDLGVETDDLWEPGKNIDVGVRYLTYLNKRFFEIPEIGDRTQFALAAYNGGIGYINKALALARAIEGKAITEPGKWQTWEVAKEYLKDGACTAMVGGKLCRPRWEEIINYVQKVCEIYWGLYNGIWHGGPDSAERYSAPNRMV